MAGGNKSPEVDIAVIYEKLDRIESQTIKTNGKVKWLEKMIYTAIGAVTILSTTVTPLVVYIFFNSTS